jgi:hypothetical protein
LQNHHNVTNVVFTDFQFLGARSGCQIFIITPYVLAYFSHGVSKVGTNSCAFLSKASNDYVAKAERK